MSNKENDEQVRIRQRASTFTRLQAKEYTDEDYMREALEDGSTEAFSSNEEYIKAMTDPRYNRDARYRGRVDAALVLYLDEQEGKSVRTSNRGLRVEIDDVEGSLLSQDNGLGVQPRRSGVTRVSLNMDDLRLSE